MAKMSGLERFINKFIATIVEYHGHHEGHDIEKMKNETNAYLLLPTEKLVEALAQKIESDNKNYPERNPLLTYCLDLFKIIKGHISKEQILDETTFSSIRNELDRFISTMQHLYTVDKNTPLTVEFNNTSYELLGFKLGWDRNYLTKTVLGGSPYCQSGQIIEDNFFKAFLIPIKASEEVDRVILEKLDTLISEFQNPLIIEQKDMALAAKDEQLLSQSLRINELEQEVANHKQQHLEDEQLLKRIEFIAVENVQLKEKITSLTEENNKLKGNHPDSIGETVAPVNASQPTINVSNNRNGFLNRFVTLMKESAKPENHTSVP